MCVRKATTNGNEKMGLKDLEKKTATSTIPLRNVFLAVYFTDILNAWHQFRNSDNVGNLQLRAKKKTNCLSEIFSNF